MDVESAKEFLKQVLNEYVQKVGPIESKITIADHFPNYKMIKKATLVVLEDLLCKKLSKKERSFVINVRNYTRRNKLSLKQLECVLKSYSFYEKEPGESL